MGAKLPLEEVSTGQVRETTFWTNAVEGSPFRFRATHLDGRRAPKVVLCDDPGVRPGVPCTVRIKAIRKPNRDDRGAIEVELVRVLDFALEGVWLDPVVSRKLQVLLESGLNILLDGPQGCGKTTLAKSIATTLAMEFVLFNCGAVIEASDFLATVQVRASESGHPVTDFVKTEILTALEEADASPRRRYLVFLDELNRCPESARNALMPALDATRRLFDPIENRFRAIPDNVQFVAAVNRGNEFSGTFAIDPAQLDRFAPVQMDYPPPPEEVKLLTKRHPGMSAALIELIVKVAARVREQPEVGGTLSVRATEEACIYLDHPLFEEDQRNALPEILKSSFCGRLPGKWSDTASDAGAAWATITAVLKEDAR